ncbi:MAG: TRAP transporter large permease [Firmicutes bacterium]|nr:TRAP transporter large permease [Bacillota bacterium]
MNGSMVAVLLVLFFALLLAGVPIIYTLMGSAMIVYLIYMPKSFITLYQNMYGAGESFSLLAIPLFILSGMLMSGGGISKRLINFFEKLMGFMHGGLAIVAIVACVFFGALSGSAPATVAAIGAIMIPTMVEKGYDKAWTADLLASTGTLGVIIPPSIPMVLFGVLSNTSVTGLFTAGIIPGVFIALCYCVYAYFNCKKKGIGLARKYSGKEIWRAFLDAIWALIMPIIILGGIYSGLFTPTEAATVSVVYALIIGLFVYKELKIKTVGKLFLRASKSTAAIVMIITTASAFATVLTRNNIPTIVAKWITGFAKTPAVFWLAFSVFMLILGMFMSVAPALVILTPILTPAVEALGINKIHFGLIFVAWMCIGTITPPFGSSLFITCGITGISTADSFKRVWPFVAIFVAAVVVLMAFPEITLLLPRLAGVVK